MLQQMLTNILRQVEEAFLPEWDEGPDWRRPDSDAGRVTPEILKQFDPLRAQMQDAAATITWDELFDDSVITAYIGIEIIYTSRSRALTAERAASYLSKHFTYHYLETHDLGRFLQDGDL